MRLLRANDHGGFTLHEFLGEATPEYAILSHTWESDEVSFTDLMRGTEELREGYRKLCFCSKQAKEDNLEYFWIDTCCIDKSSSTELTEAINMMFYWYQRSVKCYVYLTDVSIRNHDSFQHCRWFTRGWTLQELLAPRIVEFYSREEEQIGDKVSNLDEIHEITGIPTRALRGDSLSSFSISERLAWASKRLTTRIEDRSYALLGIFDVTMPLIYGEGEKAFDRLIQIIESSASQEAIGIDWESIPLPYYLPLTNDRFRVFVLDPGKIGSMITGQIKEAYFSRPPPYSALSYCWGLEPAIHRVKINNEYRDIRPNLFDALQRIRFLQAARFYV